MKQKKIPRIVRAYLLVLGLTVGCAFGGAIFFISLSMGVDLWKCAIVWALMVFFGYITWFLTARKYRELLIEWGVIE